MAGYDWDYWRHKFVTGPDTLDLRALSEIPGAPKYPTIKTRSSKEFWADQRKRYRYSLDTEAATKPDVEATVRKVEKILDTVDMLTRHSQISRALQSVAATWLTNLQDPRTKKYDPEKVARLKAAEVVSFLRLGLEAERLTEGLATARQEIDLSGMSDAELEKIANGGV